MHLVLDNLAQIRKELVQIPFSNLLETENINNLKQSDFSYSLWLLIKGKFAHFDRSLLII